MFTMRKMVKRYGNGIVIGFTPEERAIYNIDVDDVIEIAIIKVEKREEKKEDDKDKSKTIGGKKGIGKLNPFNKRD